jgi:hypothetical protein
MNRDEARTAGLPRYSTGEPCSHGHSSERYTVNGICCECHRLSVSLHHYQNREPNPMSSMIEQIAELNRQVAELQDQIGKPPVPAPAPPPFCFGRSLSYSVRPIRNGRNIGIVTSDMYNKLDGMEVAKLQSKSHDLPIRFVRWDAKWENEPGDAVLLIQELRVNLAGNGGYNKLVHEWRFESPIPEDLR